MIEFDLIVIGSGPAGQRAAIQAVKAGFKVALIEGDAELGGACLFQGTVPSKCFRESVYRFSLSLSGALRHDIDQGAAPVQNTTLPEMSRLWRRRDRVIGYEAKVVHHQMIRNEVKIYSGWAQFVSPHEVQVQSPRGEGLRLRAKMFVIATGSRPVVHEKFKVDGISVHDSNSILKLKKTPKSMIVLGAGVIGCEYASMFLMAGTEVTLVDRHPDILPFIDREIVEHLMSRFENFRMRIMRKHTPEKIEVIEKGGVKRVLLTIADGTCVEAETALVCLGRTPNVESLGLPSIGVEQGDRGNIKVNAQFQTSIPHIYAVGDVIGFPALASTSMEQGRVAVCHGLKIGYGNKISLQTNPKLQLPDNYPYGIYTIPEISTIGLTEEEARKRGIPFAVGRARYSEVVRSQIVGDRWGLLKILIDRRDLSILGVHIIGDNATEIVHIGQAVMALGGDVRYFIENVFNYPTYAEAYKTAALAAVNHDLTQEEVEKAEAQRLERTSRKVS